MKTAVIQYTTRADAADENQRLAEKVFDQLTADKPSGVHYATFRLADDVTFVHIASFDGDANPLAELPAFQEFQAGIADRCAQPPVPAQASIVGSYRFLSD
jgi:hypothetical protein